MTLSMRRETRDAWADALESGEYQQTKEVLTRLGDDGKPIGYCCLGVLCDLAVKAGVIGEPGVGDISGVDDDDVIPCLRYGPSDDEDGAYSETDLPAAVIAWAGLHVTLTNGQAVGVSDPVLVDEGGIKHSAATWNDSCRADFAQIASMVRLIEPADEPVGSQS